MWRMIRAVDCMPQFVPHMLAGVIVRQLCGLVHFSYILLLKIISNYPGTMRHGFVNLVATIISKVLLTNDTKVSHKMSWYSTPLTFLSRRTVVILHPCVMPPDIDRTLSSLDRGSLAVLLEAFSWQSMNSHVAIDKVQLKTWPISPEDVGPSSGSQVLLPPCPV